MIRMDATAGMSHPQSLSLDLYSPSDFIVFHGSVMTVAALPKSFNVCPHCLQLIEYEPPMLIKRVSTWPGLILGRGEKVKMNSTRSNPLGSVCAMPRWNKCWLTKCTRRFGPNTIFSREARKPCSTQNRSCPLHTWEPGQISVAPISRVVSWRGIKREYDGTKVRACLKEEPCGNVSWCQNWSSAPNSLS